MSINGMKQNSVRENNIANILNLLFKEQLSLSGIAKKMNLSKPAVIKILQEMETLNLVENIAENKNDQKWQRTLYKISDDAGIMCVVDFGSTYVKIVFLNLNGETIFETEFDGHEFVTMETIKLVTDCIKENKLKYETECKKLLVNVVSTSGKVNRVKGEIENSPKFKNIKDFEMRVYFENELNVKTILKNDTNLAILGEKEYGKYPNDFDDAILIFIDSGIGGAILNKGRVVEGEKGYAAEFGLITTYDKFGNKIYYDLLCSINSIKKQLFYQKSIGHNTLLVDNFRFKDVKKAFEQNDDLVVQTVKETALKIGELISNLNNIFDFSHFIIGGRISGLGDKYLDWVKDGLDSQNDIQVHFASLGRNSVIYGAITVGIKEAFEMLSTNRSEGI